MVAVGIAAVPVSVLFGRSEGASMAMVSDEPEYAGKTIIVDLPRPPLLTSVGTLFAMFGLLLRCFCRSLAWPSEWHYSGDRVNTIWAYRESLYAELGLVSLIFGLALIYLAVVRATGQKTSAEPGVESGPTS